MIDYKYRLSTTVQGASSKEHAKSIAFSGDKNWYTDDFSILELCELIKTGHSFNPDFGYTTGERFGKTGDRTKDKFVGAQAVFIDIDDCNVNYYDILEVYRRIESQMYIPNIIYTSFSHTDDNHPRLRLVYLFTTMLNIQEYMFFSKIYSDFIKDNFNIDVDICSFKPSQPFFGTNSNKALYHLEILNSFPVNNVFAKHCLGFVDVFRGSVFEGSAKNYFSYNIVSNNNRNNYRENLTLQEKTLIANKKTFKEYIDVIGHKYYRIEDNWYMINYFKAKAKDVVDIYRRFGKINKFKKGNHRRYQMYLAGMKMRMINPNITFSELVYNLTCFTQTCIINSAGYDSKNVHWDTILQKAEEVMNSNLELFIENYQTKILKPEQVIYSPYKRKSDFTVEEIEEGAKRLGFEVRKTRSDKGKERKSKVVKQSVKQTKQEQFNGLLEDGKTREEIENIMGISKRTFYRYTKNYRPTIERQTLMDLGLEEI